MNSFLSLVANDLRQKFGTDLSRVAIVCPNKRAGLFISELLAPQTADEAPVWAPQFLTISDLFHQLSPYTPADPIDTICRLHKHYAALVDKPGSLDFFYGWGERLLSDFDDVDKHLVDAPRLFRNLASIKEIENPNAYIDKEKEEVLRAFFADFSVEKNSELRAQFLKLWNVLLPLYQRLNADLAADGLAYEGALCRHVVEDLENGRQALPAEFDHYAIVGFNVLGGVEEHLFSFLQSQEKALFYWDYDVAYVDGESGQEAGFFLRRNLERFPSELPATAFDNLYSKEKEFEIVSAPTENVQARAATPWLKKHLTKDEKRTAIVLCNENLLQPLLHALPPEVHEANITKGYPLHHTQIYQTLERLMEHHEANVSNAEWIEQACEVMRVEATSGAKSATGKDDKGVPFLADYSLNQTLHTESCFQAYTILTRFHRLVTERGLNVEATTLHKLIKQVMRQTSIPFHGEPATGLQVMGLLETRCLDFENILMLSVSEGNLPRRTTTNSFIPYALRREFGMTTDRHKIAVYAYYFYRLIQRAHHVRFVYNCSAGNGMVTGEKSRFLTQLLIETPKGAPIKIRQASITSSMSPTHQDPPTIAKPADMRERFKKLSPSAINTYLRCPLNFYYQYVAGLKQPTPTASIIQPNVLGSAFHKSAELFYQQLAAKTDGLVSEAMLKPWLAKEMTPKLVAIVRQAMKEENAGGSVIVESIILGYLRQLIRHDARLGQFRLVAMEKKQYFPLTVRLADGTDLTIEVGGFIDRMDIVRGEDGVERLRIVDYKTGGRPESAKDIEQLFTVAKTRPHYVLQTFIYALAVIDGSKSDSTPITHNSKLITPTLPIAPALFFVHRAAAEDYSSAIKFGGKALTDFRPLAEDFRERLANLVDEILDPTTSFTATPIANTCKTCAFATLCKA